MTIEAPPNLITDGAVPEGFSPVECACKCGNLLPLTIYNRGWHYLRGHKGYANGESPAQKRERKALAEAKPGPVEHTSFARTLEMARENLKAAHAKWDLRIAQVAEARARIAELEAQRGAAEIDVRRLDSLIDALEALVPAALAPAQASTTTESEAA